MTKTLLIAMAALGLAATTAAADVEEDSGFPLDAALLCGPVHTPVAAVETDSGFPLDTAFLGTDTGVRVAAMATSAEAPALHFAAVEEDSGFPLDPAHLNTGDMRFAARPVVIALSQSERD